VRGSLVIARDYNGRPLVRRVWESGSKVIYLSEETQFQQLSTGAGGLRPVGFPTEDVFAYDPDAIEKIANGSLDWNSLREFNALSRQF
jgi:hypothetical protein